jgi:hypothetical protein
MLAAFPAHSGCVRKNQQRLDGVATNSQSRRHREDACQKISRRPDARRSVSKAKRNEILSDYHACT